MSVAEAQQRISSREFAEWMAFDRVEPIGGRRGDYQTAMLAALLANIYRDPKAHRRPYAVQDFVPQWWQAARPTDWRQVLHKAALVTRMLGGTVKEGIV